MINRHLNPLWPQLANENLMASIICDGFHLRPEEISVFFKVKGPGKTIITSDVTHFAAMPPGKYIGSEGEEIELTEDGRLWLPAQNVLYGSASSITKGVGNIMKITGCSLRDAIRMASTNPAELYNLDDRGKIEPSKRGDLVVFSLDGFVIKIHKTIVKGRIVFEE
jgi:N-acetylglucosamine-6-phosphate deacetylase